MEIKKDGGRDEVEAEGLNVSNWKKKKKSKFVTLPKIEGRKRYLHLFISNENNS